jgi:hypothetical protein
MLLAGNEVAVEGSVRRRELLCFGRATWLLWRGGIMRWIKYDRIE